MAKSGKVMVSKMAVGNCVLGNKKDCEIERLQHHLTQSSSKFVSIVDNLIVQVCACHVNPFIT